MWAKGKVRLPTGDHEVPTEKISWGWVLMEGTDRLPEKTQALQALRSWLSVRQSGGQNLRVKGKCNGIEQAWSHRGAQSSHLVLAELEGPGQLSHQREEHATVQSHS